MAAVLYQYVLLLIIATLVRAIDATADANYRQHATDLTSFVTRPEIKAPLLNITYKADQGVTPGLWVGTNDPSNLALEVQANFVFLCPSWFVAPYASINQEVFPSYYYQACSTGPHIYDSSGYLVWSGACAARNQNACDFRAFTDSNGVEYLTWIWSGYEQGYRARSTIVDSSYDLSTARNITKLPLDNGINMHEFKVIDGGRKALFVITTSEREDISELEIPSIPVGWITHAGLRQSDIASGHVDFEWLSSRTDGVSLSESTYEIDREVLQAGHPHGWNFFHPNSVDKSVEGDYLISGRFVDTIYKISGADGAIMWRLGGQKSSFELDGFNFSKQHDAQFLGYDEASGEELLSIFDNAIAHQRGWVSPSTSNVSSCLVVALNHESKKARLVQQIYRPDGGLTQLRGNCQRLPNGHTIGGWSDNAYISEHDSDGRLLLEAQFVSDRFVTYRAYKSNFTGNPSIEELVLKVDVYGITFNQPVTAWHVSWNGATEVVSWHFCRETAGSLPRIVGEAAKTGFETAFLSDGLEDRVYVEAIGKDGVILGRSPTQLAAHVFE